MEKIEINDELLYSCMPSLEEKMIEKIPETSNYRFSNEFEKKMERLMKRVRQKQKYGIPITAGKRIAAMLAIIFAGLLTIVMGVEATREKLFDYIETIYENYTSKQYYMKDDMIEFIPMYPTYIPEGYELVIEDMESDSLFLSYEREDATEGIVISQDQIYDKMVQANDNEYIEEQECLIQEVTGTLGMKENGIICVRWEKNHCIFVVSATNLSKEEVIKICESLK